MSNTIFEMGYISAMSFQNAYFLLELSIIFLNKIGFAIGMILSKRSPFESLPHVRER